MCIIFINQHADYPIIIAANRDEYYARPTVNAHFWTGKPILAGKDLLAGGTWLGVTRTGRFAAVTNYRQPEQLPSGKSRGLLVTDFLESNLSQNEFSELLSQTSGDYAGYNCVFGNLSTKSTDIQYVSNRAKSPLTINHGIVGLSNALLDTPWPKVILGKKRISALLENRFDIEEWMYALKDNQCADDIHLPETGLTIETERKLSPIFIQSDNYGTRCSTVITIGKSGIVNFFERTYIEEGICTENHHFCFEVNP